MTYPDGVGIVDCDTERRDETRVKAGRAQRLAGVCEARLGGGMEGTGEFYERNDGLGLVCQMSWRVRLTEVNDVSNSSGDVRRAEGEGAARPDCDIVCGLGSGDGSQGESGKCSEGVHHGGGGCLRGR